MDLRDVSAVRANRLRPIVPPSGRRRCSARRLPDGHARDRSDSPLYVLRHDCSVAVIKVNVTEIDLLIVVNARSVVVALGLHQLLAWPVAKGAWTERQDIAVLKLKCRRSSDPNQSNGCWYANVAGMPPLLAGGRTCCRARSPGRRGAKRLHTRGIPAHRTSSIGHCRGSSPNLGLAPRHLRYQLPRRHETLPIPRRSLWSK